MEYINELVKICYYPNKLPNANLALTTSSYDLSELLFIVLKQICINIFANHFNQKDNSQY